MKVSTIKSIKKIENNSKRYDIEVEHNHNFFANDILVHNCQTRWCFTKNNPHPEAFGEDKNIYISSKGQGNKGLFFKNNESNLNAYYVKAFLDNKVEEKVKNSKYYQEYDELTIYSETIGMQDLKYGLLNGQIGYRLFDVYVGKPRQGRFLNFEECKAFAEEG